MVRKKKTQESVAIRNSIDVRMRIGLSFHIQNGNEVLLEQAYDQTWEPGRCCTGTRTGNRIVQDEVNPKQEGVMKSPDYERPFSAAVYIPYQPEGRLVGKYHAKGTCWTDTIFQ